MSIIFQNLSQFADLVVLIAGVIAACYTILKPIFQAKGYFQKREKIKTKKEEDRVRELLNEELNKKFPDAEENLQLLRDIKDINVDQSEQITKLTTGVKNIQRQQIMEIYDANKKNRTIQESVRERLDALFRDYKNENGNTYIDAKYATMSRWPIIPDDND